jgi:hypothetical protein
LFHAAIHRRASVAKPPSPSTISASTTVPPRHARDGRGSDVACSEDLDMRAHIAL